MKSATISTEIFGKRKHATNKVHEYLTGIGNSSQTGDIYIIMQPWFYEAKSGIFLHYTFTSHGGDIDGKSVIGQIFQIGGNKFPDGLAPAAEFARHVVSENNTFSKNPTDHANGDGFKILFA